MYIRLFVLSSSLCFFSLVSITTRILNWRNYMLTGLRLLRYVTGLSNELWVTFSKSFIHLTSLAERSREASKIVNARSWGVQGDHRSRLFEWSYRQWESDLSFLPSRVLSLQVSAHDLFPFETFYADWVWISYLKMGISY